MIDNINEIFSPDQQQLKTRSKKVPNQQKLKEIQEQQEKHQIKLSKLSLLEEDENEKEDKDDSDYEAEDEDDNGNNKEKKKRAARPKTKMNKEIRFGKINVNKYFIYEKENINYDFPNYNNIIAKPTKSKSIYKICDVCFGFANYTCKHCQDKYCSIDCYKTHRENKCIKFLDV